MLNLLETLVRIPSHAVQPEGVERVHRAVGAELEMAGFSVEDHALPMPDPEAHWLEELMLPGASYDPIGPALVARHRGTGWGRGVLVGDLDTSYGPGAFARFPYRVEGDRALGPGIADMKGGLVVLTAALRALHDLDLTMPAETTVVLCPDEQAGSLRSRSLVYREARGADWCLCVECARNGGSLMGARGHIGVARLDVEGTEAHAGSNHAAGASAVEALACKIPRINALTDPERGVFVTVAQIGGGRRRSVVPGDARAVIDVRTPDAETWARIEAEMGVIAAADDVPGTRARLRIAAHRPGVSWTDGTDRLIEVARRAGEAAGIEFDVIRSPAAGSSAFAGEAGVPVLDGMGPLGGDLMTDHEYIEIPSLVERCLRLALTIHQLATDEPLSL
jgi:glutamate carboxypeptidase